VDWASASVVFGLVVETLPGGPQPDALEARQMQALSLAVHIPLVCFGIAFPAMFLFVEGLYLRTGNPAFKALAKRWSKVALILFAIGVVTGTILSFECGLLWPNFMASFGEVFGVAFTLEESSFFVEAIFLAIYVSDGTASAHAHTSSPAYRWPRPEFSGRSTSSPSTAG
jgi:cytochrome bd-type quinol oxidase subunit 1